MAPCFAGRNERRQPVFTLVGEWTLQEVRPMRVSDRLRDRAERLRALAVRAREDGNVALSDERLAAESSDHEDGSHAPDKAPARWNARLRYVRARAEHMVNPSTRHEHFWSASSRNRHMLCRNSRRGFPSNPPPSRRYASLEIFLRNFPLRIRCSRSSLTRSRVLSLIAPVAIISFIGVQ